MRRLIWISSLYGLLPIALGSFFIHKLGFPVWNSLVVGTILGTVAFGSFLDVVRIPVPNRLDDLAPVIVPIATLIIVGIVGGFGLYFIKLNLIVPGPFVAGILSSTIICQVSLVIHSFRMRHRL